MTHLVGISQIQLAKRFSGGASLFTLTCETHSFARNPVKIVENRINSRDSTEKCP